MVITVRSPIEHRGCVHVRVSTLSCAFCSLGHGLQYCAGWTVGKSLLMSVSKYGTSYQIPLSMCIRKFWSSVQSREVQGWCLKCGKEVRSRLCALVGLWFDFLCEFNQPFPTHPAVFGQLLLVILHFVIWSILPSYKIVELCLLFSFIEHLLTAWSITASLR